MAVRTIGFSRQREQRRLEADVITASSRKLVVDDIMVSGLTLALARSVLAPTPRTALVGMQYASKTARKRAGFADLRTVVTYSKSGGGIPPLNAVRTLAQYQERLDALCERYFPTVGQAIGGLIKEVAQ